MSTQRMFRDRKDSWTFKRDERSRDSRGGGGGRGWHEDRTGGDWHLHERRGPPGDRGGFRGEHRASYDSEGGRELGASIWIGGLAYDIKEREIDRLMSKCGPILQVSIKHSPKDTFAFVDFDSVHCAKEAIRRFDRTDPFGSGTVKVAGAYRKGGIKPDEDYHSDRGGGGVGRAVYSSGVERYRGGGGDKHSDWGGRYENHRGAKFGGRDDYFDGRGTRDDFDVRGGRGDYGGGRRGGDDYYNCRDTRGGYNNGRGRYGDNYNGRSARSHSGGGGAAAAVANGVRGSRSRSPVDKRPLPMRPWRAMLSQLPIDMEEDELLEIAGAFGQVLEHELHRESKYKAGWVEFGTKAEAEAAVAELDDRRMEDWSLKLQAYVYPGGVAQNGGVTMK
mmetsp:Transcript_94323/g.271786  ORF Transcript_94323/g.271786 Transcript_94323/m.271786 type:complete len:390 (+) Transcript_94323:239-1408(+)